MDKKRIAQALLKIARELTSESRSASTQGTIDLLEDITRSVNSRDFGALFYRLTKSLEEEDKTGDIDASQYVRYKKGLGHLRQGIIDMESSLKQMKKTAIIDYKNKRRPFDSRSPRDE